MKIIEQKEFNELEDSDKAMYDLHIEDRCINESCEQYHVVKKYNTMQAPHGFIDATGPKYAPALDKVVIRRASFPVKQVCSCMDAKEIVKESYILLNDSKFGFNTKKCKVNRSNNFYRNYSLKKSDLLADPNVGDTANELSKREHKEIATRLSKL